MVQNTSTKTKNKAGSIIATVSIISIGYAILRYNIVGSVPWKDLPFFILNKGLSLSALVLLIVNFSMGPLYNLGVNVPMAWMNARKAVGMAGFVLVLVHVLMSVMIFNPAVYAKFFAEDGTLTLFAGLSMLGGIVSCMVLCVYISGFITYLKKDEVFVRGVTSKHFLLLAMPMVGMHLLFMGYEGWLTPSKWQGGLPPISLLGFVLFAIGYIINLVGRK